MKEQKLKESLDALVQYARKLGHFPSTADWRKYANEHGYYSAVTIMTHTQKSWEMLRKQLGFEPKIKSYTKEECIKALRKAAEVYGIFIRRREYEEWAKKQGNVPTAAQLISIFGNYTEAKIASGLFPNEPFGKKYTDEECLEALKACEKDIGPLFSETDYLEWQKNHPEYPHFETIRKHFGGFNKAKEYLQLATYNKGKNINALEKEEWKSYFYRFIQDMLSIESYEKWAKENNGPSLTTIFRHAGGHKKALLKLLPVYIEELRKNE